MTTQHLLKILRHVFYIIFTGYSEFISIGYTVDDLFCIFIRRCQYSYIFKCRVVKFSLPIAYLHVQGAMKIYTCICHTSFTIFQQLSIICDLPFNNMC